jgi:hypothetical protein
MSEQEIRNHLRSALAAVVEAEQNRVSAILNDSKIKIAKGIEMMKPLITLIRALKEEVGEVEGLVISTAEHGHMATVRAQTSVTTESLSIKTNYGNSAFVIEEFSSFSIDNSCREDSKEYSSAEDAMARVLEVVGKHIGGQQAQRAHKNA